MIGMRDEIFDPTLVFDLLEVADEYQKDPEQKVTGAAVDGLRLLVTITEQWCDSLAKRLDPGASLPADQFQPGTPLTLEAADALRQRACAAVKAVLQIRREQRQKARANGGSIFTAADYDAMRLWMRCTNILTPTPAAFLDLIKESESQNPNSTYHNKPKSQKHKKARHHSPSGRQRKMPHIPLRTTKSQTLQPVGTTSV